MKSETKRLGIFIYYDQDGAVDASEEYLLNSLRDVLDRLIVVVNGQISDEGLRTIRDYADEIILRGNEGFDGGAYQDYFLHHVDRNKLQEYEELLFVNDTFYGPFYPWKRVFEQMELHTADFWGLTKHTGFYSADLEMMVTEHIQTYFVVFKKQVFLSKAFSDFWIQMERIISYEDAIRNFEISLTRKLAEAGFRYMVYTDLFPEYDYLKSEEPVFTSSCYFLLRDCEFPVLKKKNGVSALNPQTKPALQFIQTHYKYDIQMLWNNATRTLIKAKLFDLLPEFCKKYKRLYIYGCGKIGEKATNYLLENGCTIAGYLETNPKNKECNRIPIIAWRDYRRQENDGIIVALGKKNTEEVKRFLPDSDGILYLS